MLIKIGPRLIDMIGIECISPSSFTDRDGHRQSSITVLMKNGNEYRHKTTKQNDEIDEIYARIDKKIRGE